MNSPEADPNPMPRFEGLQLKDLVIGGLLAAGRALGRLVDINPTRTLATHGDHSFERIEPTTRMATVEQNFDGNGAPVEG